MRFANVHQPKVYPIAVALGEALQISRRLAEFRASVTAEYEDNRFRRPAQIQRGDRRGRRANSYATVALPGPIEVEAVDQRIACLAGARPNPDRALEQGARLLRLSPMRENRRELEVRV